MFKKKFYFIKFFEKFFIICISIELINISIIIDNDKILLIIIEYLKKITKFTIFQIWIIELLFN